MPELSSTYGAQSLKPGEGAMLGNLHGGSQTLANQQRQSAYSQPVSRVKVKVKVKLKVYVNVNFKIKFRVRVSIYIFATNNFVG